MYKLNKKFNHSVPLYNSKNLEVTYLKIKIGFVFLAFIFSLTFSLISPSIARATIYQPGETLEPDCAPGSPSCGVSTFINNDDWSGTQLSITNGGTGVTTQGDLQNLILGNSPIITTPTILTSATTPLIIGGVDPTSTLTLRSTSGVGASGADIIFQTGNNGVTEAMRILNSGNVGVGTTIPSAKLHVNYGNTIAGAAETFRLEVTGNVGVDRGPLMTFYAPNNSGTSRLVAGISGTQYPTALDQGGALTFMTNTVGGSALVERMRIDNTGNVGIGTNNPGYLLEVRKNQNATTNLAITNTDTTDSSSRAQMTITGGNVSGRLLAINNDNLYLGTLSNSAIRFQTNGANVMAITASGNVGIGTTAPTAPFHVSASSTTADYISRLVNTQVTRALGLLIQTNTASATPSDPMLQITAGANTVFKVETGGNVGIGTISPVSKLTVMDTTSASPRGIQSMQASDDTSGARLGFAKSRGTPTSPTTVLTGDTLGRLMFRGYDGTNYLEMGSIEVGVSGTVAATRIPTFLAFSTATNATPSVLTERMRIDNAGNVGIGTTNPVSKLNVIRAGDYNSEGNTGFKILSSEASPAVSLQMGTDTTNNIGFIQAMQPLVSWSTRPLVLQGNGGNVGIGNINPGALLDVGLAGTTLGVIRLAGSTSGNVSLRPNAIAGSGVILTLPATSGTVALTSDITAGVTSVSGTANRITSTGGTTPVIDISGSYVGQSSITTLGTITTGVWNGTAVAVANGGTGTTNGSITGTGALAFRSATGANAITIDSTTTGAVNIGNGNNAKTINIGTGTAGNNINVGTNDTTADNIIIGSPLDALSFSSTGLNVTTGGALTGVQSIDTMLFAPTAITFAVNGSVKSTTTSAMTLDSGTTGTVNVGTGTTGAGKIVNVGNTNGTTQLNLSAGSSGIFLTGAAAASAGHVSLCIDTGTNQLFLGATDATCNPSSIKYKHDIKDIGLGLEAINALRPVSYVYNSNNEARLGFIAEEAGVVDERLIARDKDGVIQAINPDAFAPILTRAIQEVSGLIGDTTLTIKINEELISKIQSENAFDPIAVISKKIADGKQFLTNFVAARVTAIRGYFDEVFAKKVHTEELCVKKSDGSEICLSGDELDSLLQKNNVDPSDSDPIPVEIPSDGNEPQPPAETPPEDAPIINEPAPEAVEEITPEPAPPQEESSSNTEAEVSE